MNMRGIQEGKDIVLFDGVCNLCNGFVNFILDRDISNRFVFGSLQSDQGKSLLIDYNLNPAALDSVVVISATGEALVKSNAAIYILSHLHMPWSLIRIFKVLPRWLRDMVYDVIAANRYRWFGRQDQCRLPSPELKQRFLDAY